jgi:hypothetical protein
MSYRSAPPAGTRNRRADSSRFRRIRRRARRGPVAASGVNDKGLEALELWKKRALVAFLLVSLCLGAAALLVLEAGVVYRVFEIEFGQCTACRSTPPIAAPGFTEPVCPMPIPKAPSLTKGALGRTSGGAALPCTRTRPPPAASANAESES